MSPRVKPKPRVFPAGNGSLAEYRAGQGQRLDRLTASQAIQAIREGNYDADYRAFWRVMTSPITVSGDPLAVLDQIERRVLSKATSGAGGYLVPPDFDDQLTALRRVGSVISELARTIETTDGRTLPLPTATAHGTSAWQAENAAAASPSDETFGQASLGAYKANTSVIVSEELLGDALPAFDTYLAGELASRQRVLEETAFAVGDGSGKPLGIVHSSSGFTVVTAATGSATTFKAADVLAAVTALPLAYLPNASWLMSQSAYLSLASLADTAGGLVFPSLQAAQPTLYRHPVAVSPDMPATAANARSVIFGDINAAYTVRRVTGSGVQRLRELYSDNGQVGFRLFSRLDGRPVDLSAAVVLRNSAT